MLPGNGVVPPESRPTRQRCLTVLIVLSFEGGLGLLSWPLGWLLEQPPLQTWTWTVRAAALGAAASVPMLVVGLALARWPFGPLVCIRQFFDEVGRPFFQPCRLIDLAAISLVAGVAEEMLLRGVVQGALGRWLGPWPALALTSMLFGLLHAITLTYIVLAMLAGVYLGLVWLATGNLLSAVVTHAVYDFVMLVYLLRVSLSRC
jgi:membrane protease YdiL (CAAX protease family)